MHQLVVQKAAHLLHVASGRGPAQPVASADLLQQHVDTGGLRRPRPNPERSVRGSPLALARTALPWRDGPARRSRLGSPVRAKARPPPSPAGSSLCQPVGREGLSTAQPPDAGRALPGPRPLGAGSPPNSPSLLFDGRGLF